MKKIRHFLTFVGLSLAFCWLSIACNRQPTAPELELPTTLAAEANNPVAVQAQAGQLRQWASAAQASDAFDAPEWSAEQAVGAPDTERCGDFQSAWASAGSDTQAWIELTYPVAVNVTGVNIIQSFNPNQVVKVELVGQFGRLLEIYNAPPEQIDRPCPYTLSISVERTATQYQTVRITLDQSVLGLGWNEIDAVELVGNPN